MSNPCCDGRVSNISKVKNTGHRLCLLESDFTALEGAPVCQGPRDVKQNSRELYLPQPLRDRARPGWGQTQFGDKAGTRSGAEGPKLGRTTNLSGVRQLKGLRNLGAIVGLGG